MNTKLFRNILCLFILFNTYPCSSQVIHGKGYTMGPVIPPADEIVKREIKYANNKLINHKRNGILDGVKRVSIEHTMMMKGDSSRIIVNYNNFDSHQLVERVVIEGVDETTPEDIKNGIFVVTVKPEKTTLYRISAYAKDSNGELKCYKENRRIVVFEDSKAYKKALRETYARNREYRNRYLDKYSNGVPGDSVVEVNVHNPYKNGVPTTEEILKARTRIFDNLTYSSQLSAFVEHDIIKKGDSTRIKYVFNNKIVQGIIIENVGRTTPADIRNGEFVVTVKPKKTTLYRVTLIRKFADNTIRETRGLTNHRVIVIDSENKKKYDDILLQADMYRRSGGGQRLSDFLDKLADGVPAR